MKFSKGGNEVVFDADLYPVIYEARRAQRRDVSANGAPYVRDLNFKTRFVTLALKNKHAKITALRSFIMDVCRFRLYTFTVTPPAGINLGEGDAGETTVRYWDSNFVEKQNVYQRYRYEMTLKIEEV